jgi:hypothetical protein
MNGNVLIAGLVVAGSLAAQAPWGPRGRATGPEATVTGAPYSAVEVRTSQQVLAAGNTIQNKEQATVYRDSQGRVRRESTWTGPDGASRTRVSISDPVAGLVYELDASNKTAFARPARFGNTAGAIGSGRLGMMGGARQPRAATEANVKRETLAAQTIQGVMASGTRVTRTIPAAAIGNAQPIETVHEVWMADDLKVPLMTRVSDPRFGTTVTELTNINRSQPDPALFQVPADYTVKQGPGGRGMGMARRQ